MAPTPRQAHLHAEFFRHNTLWTAAQVLRTFGSTPQGGLYGRLAAVLFAYLAFEGVLNHLGEGLFPSDWGQERELFARPPLKGTLGKLSFLATRCGLNLQKGHRPFSTLKLLDKRRSLLVHARTERQARIVRFTDARHIPDGLESELTKWTSDRFVLRAFEDVEQLAAELVSAAREAFPREMQRVYGAGFSGAISTQGGHIE